jgi:hypothetical protein
LRRKPASEAFLQHLAKRNPVAGHRGRSMAQGCTVSATQPYQGPPRWPPPCISNPPELDPFVRSPRAAFTHGSYTIPRATTATSHIWAGRYHSPRRRTCMPMQHCNQRRLHPSVVSA